LYRKLEVVGVRAVATSAIRDTRNQREFLARATEAAGAPVEIISGREEARLIHLGVESLWPQRDKRNLIIDIGGGERRGGRGGAGATLAARGDRPAARIHGASAQALPHGVGTGPGREAQDYRNRSAARGNHRAWHERAAAIPPGVSPARVFLFAGRGARRHHRRPGGAECGRRTLPAEPRSAARGGRYGTALRRL